MTADLGIAFVAGLLSCASACVLPLLPAYLAYLGGLSAAPDGGRGRRPAVLGGAGLFVAGFGSAFVVLGAGAALVGSRLAVYRSAVVTASGILLLVLGVAMLVGVPWLAREWRFHVAHRLPRTPLASYVVGVAFAAGWTPCVGPVLAAILVLAANTASAARGAALLAAYSAGLGLPFLATAGFVAPMTGLLARVRAATPALNAAAAVLLMGMGALTLTGRLTVLNGLAPQLAVAAPARLSDLPPSPPPAGQLVGRQAPAVTVADVAGGKLGLRRLRGRPVVVNFWATWCVPCRQELPLFAAAAQAHRSQGLAVVPVDFEESPGTVTRFWSDLGIAGITPYLDRDGAAARAFGVGLQETGLPVTIFLDRRGAAISMIPGEVDPQLFAARLDAVLSP